MPTLFVDNYLPPGQRHVYNGARFWRGEVQADDENDTGIATAEIIGLAGFSSMVMTLSALPGYDTIDHPELTFVAMVPPDVEISVILVPHTQAFHVTGIVRNGVATVAGVDLTDYMNFAPATKYLMRAQYDGSQQPTRLMPQHLLLIARP